MPTVHTTLTEDENTIANSNFHFLRDTVRIDPGRVFRLRYVKADGTASDREGTVVRFMGTQGMTSFSVRFLQSDESERTFNLHRIESVGWRF